MVLATQKCDVAPSEHQRRLGMMKTATKYKRIAEEYSPSRDGRLNWSKSRVRSNSAPLVGSG